MDAAGQASSQDAADRPEWPGEGPAGNGQEPNVAVAAPASAQMPASPAWSLPGGFGPGGFGPGGFGPGGFGPGPASGGRAALVAAKRRAPPPPRRLALFGLPPDVAEPVTMLAEILGWEVVSFPSGPAVCPPARLCLAMLPGSPDCSEVRGQIVAWSPDLNLNEHISRAGLSIMDQPLCITRVEQMLETLVCEP